MPYSSSPSRKVRYSRGLTAFSQCRIHHSHHISCILPRVCRNVPGAPPQWRARLTRLETSMISATWPSPRMVAPEMSRTRR